MKKNKDSSSESPGSGTLMDDVNTTATVGGSKSVVFGLAMDTIGRSHPTHMLPLHVRQVLARFMQDSNPLPFYSDDLTLDDDGNLVVGTTSVASELSVSVADAEDFGLGVETAGNGFLNYTDVPLNGEVLDRLAFWRYSPNAHELDPRMLFEPQVVAVDAMTQLFTESFDFHFNFLLTLDSEYHRLRREGPQGTLDDSAENSAWYNMYHCWRDIIEEAYLDTNLVVLPVGKQNGNWTIADVLDEILVLMTTLDGTLMPDIYLTAKGVSKAKTGATLGISGDPSLTDGDGNPRFIMPAWETTGTYTVEATSSQVVSTLVDFPGLNGSNTGNSSAEVTWEAAAADLSTTHAGATAMSAVEGTSMMSLISFLAQAGRTPPSFTIPASYRSTTSEPDRTQMWNAAIGQIMPMTLAIHDLPDANGIITHNGVDYANWRGYQLNLVQLIEQLRRMGRMLEPEVAEGFLPAFGVLGSVGPLFEMPSGMTPRTYDDLYNLYASDFTYRENPVRTYTAAHMGPIDQEIPSGTLLIEGVDVNTQTGTDVFSVRERFWTPENMTAEQVANVLSHFVPGQSYDETMLGSITFDMRSADSPLGIAVDEVNVGVPPSLVSRLLGNSSSMLTKVEKPAVLPAGVTSAETTYASGLGMGSIQLVGELVRSALYGAPKFTLGHNGFVDWTAIGRESPGSPYIYSPVPRAAASAHQGDVILFADSLNDKVDLAATQLANSIESVAPEFDVVASDAADVLYQASTNDHNVQAIAAAFPACLQPATHAYLASGGSTTWTTSTSTTPMHPASAQMRLTTPRAFCETKQMSLHSIDTFGSWGIPLWDQSHMGLVAGPPTATAAGGYCIIPDEIVITVPGGTPFRLETNLLDGLSLRDPGFLRATSEYELTETSALTGTDAVMTWNQATGKVVKAVLPAPSVDFKGVALVPQTHLGDVVIEAVSVAVGSGLIDLSEVNVNELSVSVVCRKGSRLTYQSGSALMLQGAYIDPNDFTTDWTTLSHVHNGGTVTYNTTVTWDSRQRSNLPVDVTLEATRKQSLNSYRRVTAEVVSAGRAVVTLDSVENDDEGNATSVPIYSALEAGSTLTHNHNLVAYGERSSLAPMGDWENFVWRVSDVLNMDVANAVLGSGSRVLAETSEYLSTGKVDPAAPDQDWQEVMLEHPGMFTLGSHVTQSNIPSITLVPGYRSATLAWRQGAQGVRVAHPFMALSGQDLGDVVQAYSSGDGHSVTYIIPDEPANRMVYKPFKRLVDAAVAKELKQFFVPTHERYDAIGGPFGLPFYGQPAHFRFAALVLDAELPGQFVLEKAETKTRMVDSSNRGMLTFGKVTLLDEQTDRHLLTDTVKTLNAAGYTRWANHSSGISGDVFSREYIRFVQQGRQMQRF